MKRTRLRRWNLAIQDFNLQPQYLPGRKNTVADYLSRQFHDIPENTREEIVIATLLLQKPSHDLISQMKNINILQSSNPFMKKIRAASKERDQIRPARRSIVQSRVR